MHVFYSNFSKVLTCDRFHLLQKFLHINGNTNSSYGPNNGKINCCHQVCPSAVMKLCCKLYYPKKQMSLGKSFELFKCQMLKAYIIKWCNILVNCKKGMFHNGNGNSDMSTTGRILIYLLRPFFNKGQKTIAQVHN